MKLTKKIMEEHNIHNSYNLAQAAKSPIFIEYHPATKGQYAHWQWIRFTDTGIRHREFTVTHRGAKELVLQEASALIKKAFGINITDKDVFGGYHPEGTLKKLEDMFNKEQKNGAH